ncbi:MAG TPA: CDP-glycerol glycerophosphotransferase family protein [Solirubrobacteraceae bacterium]|jgi:CDP-glycerol glycerophosphotransferase
MRIVYQSYEGRFSDSPRAVYEALIARGEADHTHVWMADPAHRAGFPEGVATVEYGSPECVELLEGADLLVANTHTDFPWNKRPETTYLQIWHGTPLKRIHWDVLWAPPHRLDRLQRDVDRWDLLVSPSPVATPLLRRAFHYERVVAETGYPRNDLLSRPDRDEVRARVRGQLGIADGRTAVLYAPTWRDQEFFPEGGEEFALRLDAGAFAERLGADHVLLLRLHYTMTGRLAAAERHESVRDVSWHPDIGELYLAADVLVTDYSSAMFDFAVTGKPILFYTYDLEAYASRLRGFYFDLEPEAPGPLLRTTGEVLDALSELRALQERWADRYAAFQAKFCALEDGHATQRVIERALRPRAR